MDELLDNAIKEQEEMLSANIGETEKYAVRYCILVLKDIKKSRGRSHFNTEKAKLIEQINDDLEGF